MVNYLRMAGLFGAGCFLLFTNTAQASPFACSGPAQIVNGHGKIVTPYCAAEHLANIGWESGLNYSAEDIRQNPSIKHEVCELVGGDIRTSNICPSLD